MECPICAAPARSLRAPNFDGRCIRCPGCGPFDVSREVLERHLLERLDKARRRDVLARAREDTPMRQRPIITSYLF
jgi:hypothetical protein